jgi:hypothetical protein
MALQLFFLAMAVSADPPKEYTDIDAATLGVVLVKEKKDPTTGFMVGGKNTTALVKGLSEINGRTIADLEKDMRPGAEGEGGSEKGFLGVDETLLKVLEADNAYVVDEPGMTHQQLAVHLGAIAAIGENRRVDKVKEPFTYSGRRFTVKLEVTRGYQHSPFRDGTKTNGYVELTNGDNGKKLGYSLRPGHDGKVRLLRRDENAVPRGSKGHRRRARLPETEEK